MTIGVLLFQYANSLLEKFETELGGPGDDKYKHNIGTAIILASVSNMWTLTFLPS